MSSLYGKYTNNIRTVHSQKNKHYVASCNKRKRGIIGTEHMHTFQGKKMYFVYSCKQKERREEGTLDLYKAIHRSVISPHVPAVFVQIFHRWRSARRAREGARRRGTWSSHCGSRSTRDHQLDIIPDWPETARSWEPPPLLEVTPRNSIQEETAMTAWTFHTTSSLPRRWIQHMTSQFMVLHTRK